MDICLDHRRRRPIYTQIVDQVAGLVDRGELKPGEQLPTIRDVAATLGINFNTVARAYRLLHEQGLISTQRGRGTYVVGPRNTDPELRSRATREMVGEWVAEARAKGFRPEEIGPAWEEEFRGWSGSGAEG